MVVPAPVGVPAPLVVVAGPAPVVMVGMCLFMRCGAVQKIKICLCSYVAAFDFFK